jgi:HSP20 family protein
MALMVRPQPFSRDVDRLMDAFFGSGREAGRWNPPMDLVEAEDHYTLRADLPGLAEDDVSIEVQDETLTISGERQAEERRDGDRWYRYERSYGSFSRTLSLPNGVDPDAIDAKFDRGVLEVRIPKPEVRKPRRVEIRAGGNGAPAAVEGSAQES